MLILESDNNDRYSDGKPHLQDKALVPMGGLLTELETSSGLSSSSVAATRLPVIPNDMMRVVLERLGSF